MLIKNENLNICDTADKGLSTDRRLVCLLLIHTPSSVLYPDEGGKLTL